MGLPVMASPAERLEVVWVELLAAFVECDDVMDIVSRRGFVSLQALFAKRMFGEICVARFLPGVVVILLATGGGWLPRLGPSNWFVSVWSLRHVVSPHHLYRGFRVWLG